jgi:carbamoyl-phosphate synthase large subunit
MLALALKVRGLMNVQFAVKDGEVYLIEVNPRASRTVPFVAKAIGTPVAKIAARVMAGEPLMGFLPLHRDIRHIAVKEAVFPFARFPGVDPVLSPEMKSTGEVMGIDHDFAKAFLKSQLGSGISLPDGGTLFVSVKDSDKPAITGPVRALAELGFKVIATSGTATWLAAQGIAVEQVNKVTQGRPHIVDRIKDGGVDMIFNTTEGWQSHKDSASIRASALMAKVPYFTTAASSAAVVRAIAAQREHSLEVRSLQDYYYASRA